MYNPFSNYGEIVEGSRFLGRRQSVRGLENRLVLNAFSSSAAVVGMSRIGKSSLVRRVFSLNATPIKSHRIIVGRTSLRTCASAADLYSAIARELARVSQGLTTSPLLKAAVTRMQATSAGELPESIVQAGRAFVQTGLRPVLVLEDFDWVRHFVRDDPAGPLYFNWLRELGSDPEFKVALVLVAKLMLEDVSRQAGFDSGYWHNVVQTTVLRGFSAEDMEEYYRAVERAGVRAGDAFQREADALCGDHPYLLDMLAYHAVEEQLERGGVDLARLRDRVLPEAISAYEKILQGFDEPKSIVALIDVLHGLDARVAEDDMLRLVSYGLVRSTASAAVTLRSEALAACLWQRGPTLLRRYLNQGRWSEPEMVQALQEALSSLDPARRSSSAARDGAGGRPPGGLRGPVRILHLTDLHFAAAGPSSGHYFHNESECTEYELPAHDRRGLLRSLLVDLREQALVPDLVVVTGDLLDRGDASAVPHATRFLAELAEQLGVPRSRVVLLPGNHDEVRSAPHPDRYRPFCDLWNTFYGVLRPPRDPAVPAHQGVEWFGYGEELGVEVVAFNSCELLDPASREEHGSIGRAQRDRAEELLAPGTRAGWFRIAAMHHHLDIPVGVTRQDYSVMYDAAAVRGWLARHRFRLALHGHQHCAGHKNHVEGAWNLAIVAGASAGVANYGRARWSLRLGYQVVVLDSYTRGRRVLREYDPASKEWAAVRDDLPLVFGE